MHKRGLVVRLTEAEAKDFVGDGGGGGGGSCCCLLCGLEALSTRYVLHV